LAEGRGQGGDATGSSFDFNAQALLEELRTRRAKLVALQLPEGLKGRAAELVELIESTTDATVIVSADPCYGACDLIDDELRTLGVDQVVHLGHTELRDTPPSIQTIFVEVRLDLDVDGAILSAMEILPPGGRVGLLTTAQHRHQLPRVQELLETGGFTAVLAEGGQRLAFPGQVLGCDLSAARASAPDIDAFLVVGGGSFHAVGVALATKHPVVVADVELGQGRSVDEDRDRILRRRAAVIALARDADRFGVIVSTRPGQRRWELALRIRELLRDGGRRPVLLALREVTPDRLEALGIDAYVSTACPRIAIDDQEAYGRPVLTPRETRVLLGLAEWEDYAFDEIG
jgi:2-(3-amino-3-carboxypropyl)histidine synthase